MKNILIAECSDMPKDLYQKTFFIQKNDHPIPLALFQSMEMVMSVGQKYISVVKTATLSALMRVSELTQSMKHRVRQENSLKYLSLILSHKHNKPIVSIVN